MSRFVLRPTVQAQWQALVKDAEKICGQPINDELEQYLILLLENFSRQPEAVLTIVGQEFLESLQRLGSIRQQKLREVGDKCLLVSGLFPARAQRVHVAVSYYVEVGQQAYHLVSLQQRSSGSAELYTQLEKNFVVLMDTLQCMRELVGEGHVLSILQAEELWRTTHSKHALKILRERKQGKLIMNKGNLPKLH